MSTLVIVILTIVILLALFLPFTVHAVEQQLESFLFVLGIIAVTAIGAWSWPLVGMALVEPIKISLAVLIIGLLFRRFRLNIAHFIEHIELKIGLKKTIILLVGVLGLFSSVITAIVAALILCEIAATLRLTRRDTLHVIIMGCFAIGLGAVLTPLGEPLSTIVVSKLSGEPHNAGFFYLLHLLWYLIIPGVAFFAYMAGRIQDEQIKSQQHVEIDSSKDILIRAAKVYLFIMALVFFGHGLTPLAEISIMKLPLAALYWANSISAILDNATLAAAEIVPTMTNTQIEFLLMGLVISGGFLIPGNIPNIICASKFKIKSKEWAKQALPIGAACMLVYFLLLELLPKVK